MEINQYTREELMKLGIYDLRQVGREVGVPSPTSLNKKDLIDYIVAIVYGSAEKKSQGKLRGRPAKSGQKSYQKFIDLIDKVETPKVKSTFISFDEDENDRSFSYLKSLSMKVASPGEEYHNDAEPENELTLRKGIICLTERGFVARKLKFIDNLYDAKISQEIVDEYGLKEDDIIEYLNDDFNNVAQIVKINDEFITLSQIKSNKLRAQEQGIDIRLTNKIKVRTDCSTLVYSPNSLSRTELIELADRMFQEEDFNVVKICYDRVAPQMGALKSYKKSEFFAESVGDEYETIEMTEAGIERAKFYSSLGYKSVLLIDNVAWLSKVLESHPTFSGVNILEQIAKLPMASKVAVVCFSGYMPNGEVEKLSNQFGDVLED